MLKYERNQEKIDTYNGITISMELFIQTYL